jgi:hypothetical protein
VSDINAPVAWKVSGRLPTAKLTGTKDATEETTCDTAEKADAYKRILQDQGWVATVTPVFVSPQKHGKVRKRSQGRMA